VTITLVGEDVTLSLEENQSNVRSQLHRVFKRNGQILLTTWPLWAPGSVMCSEKGIM
ncbi:hypothetical protein ACJMK2_009971, partial [Sinanodonta woodiana]